MLSHKDCIAYRLPTFDSLNTTNLSGASVTLSHDETKFLIDFVLETDKKKARGALHMVLIDMNRTEPEFYDGVLKHGPFMTYTAEQWFDFHSKISHWHLRDDPALMSKLSPAQQARLS